MKALFLILLFIISINSNGQIPVLVTNTVHSDSIKSDLLNTFNKHYDFIIGYTADSWWGRKRKYTYTLALKNDKWYLIRYIRIYNLDSNGSRNKIIKIKTKRYKLNKHEVEKLLNTFENQRIWTLNTDSLNINERYTNEGKMFMSVSDGINHTFEFITKDRYRIVSAYAPEIYLERFPEYTQRENFIKCKTEFISLISKRRKYLR